MPKHPGLLARNTALFPDWDVADFRFGRSTRIAWLRLLHYRSVHQMSTLTSAVSRTGSRPQNTSNFRPEESSQCPKCRPITSLIVRGRCQEFGEISVRQPAKIPCTLLAGCVFERNLVRWPVPGTIRAIQGRNSKMSNTPFFPTPLEAKLQRTTLRRVSSRRFNRFQSDICDCFISFLCSSEGNAEHAGLDKASLRHRIVP